MHQIWESQFEFPETRATDDPMYRSPNNAKPPVGCCTSMQELRINISESQFLSDATKTIVNAFIIEQFEKERQQILEAFENGVNCGVENQYAFSDLFATKYFNETYKNNNYEI